MNNNVNGFGAMSPKTSERIFSKKKLEKQNQRDDNFIRTAENILPNELVDSLLNLGDNKVNEMGSYPDPSKLPALPKLNNVFPDGEFWQPRNDNVVNDSHFVLDPFWPIICQEINVQLYKKLVIPYVKNYPTLTQYTTQYLNGPILFQKTERGEGYHQFHAEQGEWSTRHRMFAWSIYLNDVKDGGETEFLYQKTRFKPKRNVGLLWPGGFTHTHRGNPPLSETKYILTGWIIPVGGSVLDASKIVGAMDG